MFGPTSRYFPLEKARHTMPDGREVAFQRRRFLPRGERMQVLVDVTVVEGDRLDLITARTIGDPEQFWRVADANNAMNPFDLTAEAGRTLHVPIPEVIA